MHNSVMQFLINALDSSVDLIERLITGIPGAYTAIIWGVFVTLALGFLIIPIRGAGVSDLASARAALVSKKAEAKRNSYEQYKANRDRLSSYNARYNKEK